VGWTQVFANILLPISILIAGWTLWEQTAQSARAASARQVDQFYSQGLLDAQNTLFRLWSQQDLDVLRTPQSRGFVDAFVERTISTSDQSPGEIRAAILSIASFFDRTETCINSGRCEPEEIIGQVGQYGRDFQCIYAHQIKIYRDELVTPYLGLGLEKFASRLGGCS